MPSDMPKVSILIPCYNQEAYIRRAVLSALNISYENLEVVCADDCSTDGTFDVLTSIKDKRLKVYKNERNLGRVKNYHNLLFNLSDGDWAVNLDGDDYYIDSRWVSEGIEKAIHNENIVLILADRYKERKGFRFKQEAADSKYGVLDGTEYFLNFYKKEHAFFHLTSLYNREEALKRNFYTYPALSSDVNSLLKLIAGKKIYHLKTCAASWCDHGGNSSTTSKIEDLVNNLSFIEDVYNDYKERDVTSRNSLDLWLKDALIFNGKRIIRNFLVKGQRSDAEEFRICFNERFKFTDIKSLKTGKLAIYYYFLLIYRVEQIVKNKIFNRKHWEEVKEEV